jgi:hypothetical protein
MIQTVILRRERGERRKRDERVRGAREGIVCACVCERERERERETDGERAIIE